MALKREGVVTRGIGEYVPRRKLARGRGHTAEPLGWGVSARSLDAKMEIGHREKYNSRVVLESCCPEGMPGGFPSGRGTSTTSGRKLQRGFTASCNGWTSHPQGTSPM